MPKKPKSTTVIADKLLEPFYIVKDDMCYTVNEKIIPDKNHFRSVKGGKVYDKPQGYYPNFDQALLKVAREKLHTKKDYESLNDFLNEFKLIENNIKNYIDGIRSTI